MALWHFMAMPGNEQFQWGGTNRARNGDGSSWSMQHPQPVTLSASSAWIFWMAKPYVSKPVIGLLSNMSFPEWMLFWMYHLCWQTWWHFGNIEKTLPRQGNGDENLVTEGTKKFSWTGGLGSLLFLAVLYNVGGSTWFLLQHLEDYKISSKFSPKSPLHRFANVAGFLLVADTCCACSFAFLPPGRSIGSSTTLILTTRLPPQAVADSDANKPLVKEANT